MYDIALKLHAAEGIFSHKLILNLMSLFHHLNYEPSVPQLGKVTAINKQTTIWRNFGGHSPVAGLTRLHDRCTKPKASLIPPLTWE